MVVLHGQRALARRSSPAVATDQPEGPVVRLLAAGSGTSDPGALLGSPQLKDLLAEASAGYDLVLIDSPPVLSVSDAIPLATAADAVVVVARAEFTTRDAAQRCRQALERVDSVTVLGVVANAVGHDDQHKRLDHYPPRSRTGSWA
jgi:Mrp family chromosome partitioning ATPase